MQKHEIAPDFVWYDSFSAIGDFKLFLEQNHHKYDLMFFGCISSNNSVTIPLLMDYFPVMLEQNDFVLGNSYLFSKSGDPTRNLITALNFEGNGHYGWKYDNRHLVDSVTFSGHFSCLMTSDDEWGPTFTVNLHEIISHRNNFIDVSLKVRAVSSPGNAMIVSELEADGELLQWSSSSFEQFVVTDSDSGNWFTVHHSVKLSDIHLRKNKTRLKVYIWNKDRQAFFIDDFEISLRRGNPVLYGLTEKL
jgi:hypothetical protein